MSQAQRDPFDKPFSWSYSKLKNYETCAHRHLSVDILRLFRDEESEELAWGNRLHDALAAAIGTDDNDKRRGKDKLHQKPLPSEMAAYQPLVDPFLRARREGHTVLAECSLAINRKFQATEWFAPDAWYRCKVDAMLLTKGQPFALAKDWKTGKRKEDSPQLAMTALCIFAHHPNIESVRTEFVWLKQGLNVVDRNAYHRRDRVEIWNSIMLRVEELERAWTTKTYPMQPGGLCRAWCPVRTCPHHGR
jgi:hypothetical protein